MKLSKCVTHEVYKGKGDKVFKMAENALTLIPSGTLAFVSQRFFDVTGKEKDDG